VISEGVVGLAEQYPSSWVGRAVQN